MIIRLSQKLARKLKVSVSSILPADSNPFGDWSANLFIADRTQYILLTNTASLYSTVMYGRGAANRDQFLERVRSTLHDLLVANGQEFVFQSFIAPAIHTVHFSKALSRSVTGSMNDLIVHARMRLTERSLDVVEISANLNEIPMSALRYRNAQEAFRSLEAC